MFCVTALESLVAANEAFMMDMLEAKQSSSSSDRISRARVAQECRQTVILQLAEFNYFIVKQCSFLHSNVSSS